MDRTIATGSVVSPGDTAPGSGTPQFATDGNPGGGIPATVIPAYQWNAFQEEICGAIVASGQTLDKTNNGQLALAIQNGGRALSPRAAASYTYAAGDKAFITLRSNAGAAMADTLPGTGPGVMASRWTTVIKNSDLTAILALMVGTGANLDGVAGKILHIGPGQTVVITSDGTNYFTLAKPDLCKLRAATTIYVATTGSDSNHGLTSGAPFLTLQAAYNLIDNGFHLNNNVVTIQLADGTYTAGLAALGQSVGSSTVSNIVIQGNAGTPSNVIISTTGTHAINAANGALITVQNMKLQTASNGYGIAARTGSAVRYLNIVFGACSPGHVYADVAGYLLTEGNYSIVGAAVTHIKLERGGIFYADVATLVTITGNPNFSGSFASASDSEIDASNLSFSGTATGTRYAVSKNGVIDTNGGGANFFPGNGAGTPVTGGQYV